MQHSVPTALSHSSAQTALHSKTTLGGIKDRLESGNGLLPWLKIPPGDRDYVSPQGRIAHCRHTEAGQAGVDVRSLGVAEFVGLLDNVIHENFSLLVTETSHFLVRSIAGAGIAHVLFSAQWKAEEFSTQGKKAIDWRGFSAHFCWVPSSNTWKCGSCKQASGVGQCSSPSMVHNDPSTSSSATGFQLQWVRLHLHKEPNALETVREKKIAVLRLY